MERSIYDYDDYKTFVLDRIEAMPAGGRGVRRRLGEAIGCQVAYVSHVLAANRHFSPEQAEALARFFSLRSDESEYLYLLVEYARAGTQALRTFLRRQLEKRRADYRELQNRVGIRNRISPDDQATYYSSWQYQAVRMLLTVPGFRTPKAIARKLSLPLERVIEILSFFVEKGLAVESGGGYTTTDAEVYLGSDSPLIGRLHANWRVHALSSLDRRNPADLHYSAAVTLSHVDYERVREILTKAILASNQIIRPSKEERLCVMAMDFYEV